MRELPRITLKLAKEDFKFAAAHFTLFPDAPAERLHGHNYRVRIELVGNEIAPSGLLLPVAAVKAEIRRVCEQLDERTLIPEKSPALEIRREGGAILVALGKRQYRLPADEVRLLPLPNVTIELLAEHLWQSLAGSLAGGPIHELCVEVEESAGQSCSYRNALRHS